jgi:hypothetical protein
MGNIGRRARFLPSFVTVAVSPGATKTPEINTLLNTGGNV